MLGLILVKDLNKSIFPSPFLEYLPETCETCGSPTEVVETFSLLQCSNSHCISKVSYRLFRLLRELGIDLLTVDECMKFLKEFDTLNPYSILLYNPENDGELYEGYGEEKSNILYSEINKKRGMLLWEYIKLGFFENLSVSSEKLLRDYNNIYDFYNDLGKGGISFIQKLLLNETDLKDTQAICIDAVLIYETLVLYKEEIIEGLQGVKILNPQFKLSLFFANDVIDFKNNQAFLNYVNIKLKHQIYIYPAYSLNENVDLIFWNDTDLGVYNSALKKCISDFPDIKIVNEDNIFEVLLEVLSLNE